MPRDTVAALGNPYLVEAMRSGGVGNSFDLQCGFAPREEGIRRRSRMVHEYAWAIPNQRALVVIVSLSPLVEIGAGGGYWARLIRDVGGDIVAYDLNEPPAPPTGAWKAWTDVEVGGADRAGEHSDRTLFLCWPDCSNAMASEALVTYRGQCVVYVGEPQSGCTADDAFFIGLERDWDLVHRVGIPQWFGFHDDLTVWTRKASR